MRFDSRRGLVGLDLRGLGDDEALGHERAVADEQQRRGQHQLHPHAVRRHEHEVRDQQRDEHAAGDRQRLARP